MNVLVTGASGFIGQALAADLAARGGHAVFAAARRTVEMPGVTALTGDVADAAIAASWIAAASPDVIVHLAAQSLPGVSWEQPAATFDTNVNGTLNLLTALNACGAKARLVMVSSSSVYAPPTGHTVLSEDAPQSGSSPYAWSKLAAEQAAFLYGRHVGIPVMSVRPFFIIGAGKTGDVSSDFARRIVAIERGASPVLSVGNLAITRDFLDIEDAVNGFHRIIEAGEAGRAYNLCSGVPTTIQALLDGFRAHAGSPLRVEVNPGLVRPIDEPYKVGDPGRLAALGWSRTIPLEESILRLLEYWREGI
jgi:GDP-4-dehydro-6-deoxy-D-mannose reductase